MSPNITWKGDGPLMVGGLIGGSDKCCCENPPPPDCYCPDHCSYYVEILSPEIVSVKSPTLSCPIYYSNLSNEVSQPEWLFAGIEYLPGWSVCGYPYAQPSVRGVALAGVQAEVSFNAYFCNPNVSFDYVEVSGSAQITLACYEYGGAFSGTPQIDVSYIINARRYVTPPGYFYGIHHSHAFITSGATVFPQTYCQYNDKRSCGAPAYVSMPPNGFKYIETPFDVLIERDSATLNGEETALRKNQAALDAFGSAEQLGEFIEAISGVFSATFRITSRPSCATTDCSCSASLAGTTMSFNGETFTIGNEPNPTRGVTTQTWLFTDGATPSITYEVYDATFTQIQVRIIAELFCSSDEEDPNIPTGGQPTWWLIAYSDCFTWENGVVTEATRDTWLGPYACYEHCGEFLPFGSPYPYLRIDSETATPSVGPCDPPYAPSVVLDWSACE